MGKRLQELTKDRTKCMIEVAGELIIDRLLHELNKLGLTRIIIVTGHGAALLEEHVLSTHWDTEIVFIYNQLYSSTNNIYSLSLAKEYLVTDDCIILESDIVFQDGILSDLLDLPFSNVSVLAKYEYWMDGTMVQIDHRDNITKFISKDDFNSNDTHLYYKTVNIYKFGQEFLKSKYLPFLEAYIISFGQHQFYEQVLNVLSFIDKSDLKCMVLTDQLWYEIDNQQDLSIANILFSREDALSTYMSCYGGYWRFPDLLDFCYLVNPYFPPQNFLKEFSVMSDKLLTAYPSGRRTLDFLASRLFNIQEDYTCVANGASELIRVLGAAIKGKIGVIYPTFEEYHHSFKPHNIVPYRVPRGDFRYSVDELIHFFSINKVKTILLVNPDNPSGNCIPSQDLIRLVKWAQARGIYTVVDESFLDFSEDSDCHTLLHNDILEGNRALIVVKSISKSYGVPGLRLGIVASADSNIISKIRQKLPIWNINSYAEYFLQRIHQYLEDYSVSCQKLREERGRFFTNLSSISFLEVYPSAANYFLCNVLAPFSSTQLSHMLLVHHRILIKDCTDKIGMEGSNLIRVAIRGPEDNDRLIHVLRTMEVRQAVSPDQIEANCC